MAAAVASHNHYTPSLKSDLRCSARCSGSRPTPRRPWLPERLRPRPCSAPTRPADEHIVSIGLVSIGPSGTAPCARFAHHVRLAVQSATRTSLSSRQDLQRLARAELRCRQRHAPCLRRARAPYDQRRELRSDEPQHALGEPCTFGYKDGPKTTFCCIQTRRQWLR